MIESGETGTDCHKMRQPISFAAHLPDPTPAVMMIHRMRHRKLVFAFFAAAMLVSTIREWSAPVGCPRLELTGRQVTHRR
jgi:hypothetical protein